MKYSDLILSVYDDIGRKPRGNQLEVINDVLVAFFDDGCQNVVLNAPTGIGKSIIGGVISGCVDKLDTSEKLASIISMGTNALAKQYHETFEDLDHHKFFQIRGAGTYPCAFMEAQPSAEFATGEECCKGDLHETEVARYCRGCEYDHAKKMINKTECLITNFAYFLTSSLKSDHLIPRKLHIFDEAHVFNDAYTNFLEINISAHVLDKYIKELADVNNRCDNEAAALVMLKKKIENGEIHESNYIATLEILKNLYGSASETLNSQANLLKGHDVVKSVKYAKLAKKYENLMMTIRMLFDNEYEHVFDNSTPNVVTVKLIFVQEHIEPCLAERNLFMSATITEDMAYNILGLDKKTTRFIMLESVFPPENKPVFFIGKTALNFNTLKDPAVIRDLQDKTQQIVNHHKGTKGLIIVPSFYLGSTVVKNLTGVKVFEHVQGTKLPDIIRDFKSYVGDAVLVSPSIFEGLDFKNDESRYQIIVKTPYASLGDKRIKHICDNYPTAYQEMALLKLIQGAGRSVRTPEDYAATYILDLAAERLFNGKLNLWKDHFKILAKGK